MGEEVREKQRKKASFAAKLNKFSSSQDGQKNSNTETKKMVQRFNSWEGQEERDKEAKIRKEEFEKTAGMFKEGEVVTSNMDNNNTEVAKKLSIFEQKELEEGD